MPAAADDAVEPWPCPPGPASASRCRWSQRWPRPPRRTRRRRLTLLRAIAPASPLNVQSGGRRRLRRDGGREGSVTAVDIVQDVAPYGDALREAIRGSTLEPAREQGRVRARRVAPRRLPAASPSSRSSRRSGHATWRPPLPPIFPGRTSVTVPPYPPNALGSGKVILEADVTEEGKVTSPRGPQSRLAVRRGRHRGPPQESVFRPATRDGRPTAVSRIYLLFSFVGTTPDSGGTGRGRSWDQRPIDDAGSRP